MELGRMLEGLRVDVKVVVGQQQEHVTHIANEGDRNGTTNKIKVGNRR